MVTDLSINVVWFKRDLRLTDHAPLAQACAAKVPVLLLYLFEPELMAAPDHDLRHARFAWQSLQNLQRLLGAKHLCIMHASAIDALAFICQKFRVLKVLSYEETGNALSFERDKAVQRWCLQRGLTWLQFPHKGIMRGLHLRQRWSASWFTYASAPVNVVNFGPLQVIDRFEHPFEVEGNRPFYNSLQSATTGMQPGGPTAGTSYLQGFTAQRCLGYQYHISKPTESRISCSRLSPYLAYGSLSLRQVYQAASIQAQAGGQFKKHLKFFQQRLLWHAHFVQKFETLCSIEFENMNPGFNAIRLHTNDALVEAWKTGTTGVPMVDACMRCLQQTGYINFRMRAMLVSFLTHHLWQPWQAGAAHLARQFLDYEPGIHYPQFQMQAGVTGINTIRIYNPVKQGQEHDSKGVFVKKWLPQLQQLPDAFVHEPWKLSLFEQKAYGCVLGHDYPMPVIALEDAAKYARAELWKAKRLPAVKYYSTKILGVLTERSNEMGEGA
ncbi:MAG: deoxyribodipyrimidine photo-lyase [Bacteroidetes bacterium]|nr:MAG: deoxyribodipyrimidine photo-lyase [Bacteroidota bacterium]